MEKVCELQLWQITSLDRSMKEHEILRQPPSEWTCLWALNDALVPVTAFLQGNEVSLAVPITWFISQVSWSRAGKGRRWWGADICRIGPVCWMLGCWSSCSGGKKWYHKNFHITTRAFQHFLCIIFLYVCLFLPFKRIYSLDESSSDIICTFLLYTI